MGLVFEDRFQFGIREIRIGYQLIQDLIKLHELWSTQFDKVEGTGGERDRRILPLTLYFYFPSNLQDICLRKIKGGCLPF